MTLISALLWYFLTITQSSFLLKSVISVLPFHAQDIIPYLWYSLINMSESAMQYHHMPFLLHELAELLQFFQWRYNSISLFSFSFNFLSSSYIPFFRCFVCKIFFENEQKIVKNKSSCNVPWTHFLSKLLYPLWCFVRSVVLVL